MRLNIFPTDVHLTQSSRWFEGFQSHGCSHINYDEPLLTIGKPSSRMCLITAMLGHMKDEDTAAVLAEELKDSNVKGSIGD